MIEFNISVPIAVLFSLAMTCLVTSGFLLCQEIGEINKCKSSEEQISYWGMYPGKMSRIKREYKKLYPSGKVELMRFAFQIAAFVFTFLLLIPAGLFR